MLDLRSTLTKYRVQWRDVGPNTSRGNVNICCPFCKNDPSFHLAISEDGKGWYCWRNSRHHGGGLGYLFSVLKIPLGGLDLRKTDSTPIQEKDPKVYSRWREFEAASSCQDMRDYLEYRGFTRPAKVADQFDLKYDPLGKWTGRLLIPLTQGWTGRAVFKSVEPRYLSETDDSGFFSHGRSSAVILVEGPLDAIRIASLTSQFTVIATTGKRMSNALMYHLRALGTQSIHLVPDADVSSFEYLYFLRYLRSFLPHSTVEKVSLPKGFKDNCEMTEEQNYAFLRQFRTGFTNSLQG